MSEATKIQKPTLKAGETASLPDVTPCPEYPEKDTWYSLMTQLFHAPSALNSLPEAWGRMMGANRAHLVIMLREAGAGHDPFGDAEWPSTPTQVWENLAKVEQLPNLDGADLSGLDFKWADLSNTDLTGTDLRWTTLVGANPGGRRPERSHHRRDEPRGSRSDRGQPDGGQPALRIFGRHQAGRSHRAGTLAQEKPGPPEIQNAEGATKCL